MVRPRPTPTRSTLPPARRGLARQLPDLHAELEHQRDFRLEQLTQLRVPKRREMRSTPRARKRGPARDTTGSTREVQAIIEAGARRALDDIELALARIRTGSYGRCRMCGADIALAVIEAIPQTTTCLRCQRR